MSKTALITGGNSGIGYATAKLLKQNNYDVCITGRNTQELKKASIELGVNYIVADLSSIKEIIKLATAFENTGLDALVNNAGIANPMPIENYSLDNFNSHIQVNLLAPVFLIKHLLPPLEKHKGCITNVSSIITKKGVPNFGIYAATKGAIESFTRNMAIELAPKAIRINAICPGAIDTPMFSKLGRTLEEMYKARQKKTEEIPLKRFGNPDEVAQVIFAQIEATYVTGSIWNVDGGVDT